MKIEKTKYWMQFHIIPTIIYTFDKRLYGWYELTLTWGIWGISLTWGNNESNS